MAADRWKVPSKPYRQAAFQLLLHHFWEGGFTPLKVVTSHGSEPLLYRWSWDLRL